MAQKVRTLKPILAYPNKMIAQLRSQIDRQLVILGLIKAVIPQELARHALHCVLNRSKLLIYTDSANWASQLRFHGNLILGAIEPAVSVPVTVLQVKVVSLPVPVSPQRKMAVIPSKTVTDEIHSQSLMSNDQQLKIALDRLNATLTRLQQAK